jgi:hypothetical protein
VEALVSLEAAEQPTTDVPRRSGEQNGLSSRLGESARIFGITLQMIHDA